MASRQPLVVEVLRGPVVESAHQVMMVVVNELGHVREYWGHPQFLTVPRSAIKMLQALPLIESGAADKWGLEDKHIALACSSHRGEKEHLAGVSEWLKKVGIREDQYVCAPHAPFSPEAAEDMSRRGVAPTAICNNCSGKHAGIITTCMHMGEDPAHYGNYEHPAQKRLRQVLSETMKVDHSKMPHGIDGCGIPTYAVPLQSMAMGMATFINPKETPTRRAAAERILQAIKNQPFYLSGSGEFVTAVIEKSQGRAIVKNGAEGVMCGVLPEKKFAFAIKTLDGAERATEFAAAALLLQLGGLTEAEFKDLSQYTQPPITNWKGDIVGQMRIAKNS